MCYCDHEGDAQSAAGMKQAGNSRIIDQTTFDDVIARIVEVADPERIVLFGSTVHGNKAANNDLDLLIVKDGTDPLDLTARIYSRLHGVGAAVDAIVVSSEDVERFRDSHALVIKPALQEGEVVYESARTLRA